MNESTIELHKRCIEKNLPFVTFRLPRQEVHTTYIQTSPHKIEWSGLNEISAKKGFIMAPFDTRNGWKYLMVKPDIIVSGESGLESALQEVKSHKGNGNPSWNDQDPYVINREKYLDQVRSVKNNISKGSFQKAVLSRITSVEGNYIPVIMNIFEQVCRKHPNAFVYIFKNDNTFWLGASPEPLLRQAEGMISTVSLAGTRPATKPYMELCNWTMKEILEQEYVTRYIHDILREFRIRDYRVTSPYVKQAGDLVHLRTDFSFSYKQIGTRIWELLDALHPTPAVAGQPKEDAISYIKQLEPHDREYYAGFLGPIQSDQEMDLFVNLRCMKITPDGLSLYIGGGITLESIPEDEWEETNLKADSLLTIIESFSKQINDREKIQTAYR